MEQQSRVKKYAQLREMISQDQEETNFHDALAPFAKRLSAVDQKFSVEDRDVKTSDYTPLHAKNQAYRDLLDDSSEDLITNDFLEQFIEEVKNYNVKEGTRIEHETTRNVISTFLKDNKIKDDLESLHVISEEDDDVEESIDTFDEGLSDDEIMIDDVLNQLDKQKTALQANTDDALLDDDWYTRTQQLSKTVETMEHSLSNVNEKVLVTNRLVNFLLAIFILGLLIVSAYVVFTILGLQGLL
jgi:phosphoenolpyruvate carboxylase